MKQVSILYGIIGLLVGIVLTGFFGAFALNNNNRGMMGLMGMNSNRVMGGEMDRKFIEQMIPHHEDAIAIAGLAKEKSKHDEIKKLAENIITSQTAEINAMKQWYRNWYGSTVPIVSTDHMRGSHMMNDQTSIDSLNAAANFDEAFLAEMIDHHQMAVMMANMLEIATYRPEMKRLASDIITTQTKEINDMRLWQQQWGYDDLAGSTNGMMEMMH